MSSSQAALNSAMVIDLSPFTPHDISKEGASMHVDIAAPIAMPIKSAMKVFTLCGVSISIYIRLMLTVHARDAGRCGLCRLSLSFTSTVLSAARGETGVNL